MARNKYDIDETLETPFNIAHLKRSFIYMKKHKKRIVIALILSALSSVFSMFTPLLSKVEIDYFIPQKNIVMIVVAAVAALVSIVISVKLGIIRQRIMTDVGQDIIYEIRRDLFEHLQELSFEYYDDRPQGKILVRVVNYVNSVSDMLTNGVINFVLEIFNIILILIFMLIVDIKLTLVVVAGVPVFVAVMLLIKKKQRRAWQDVSNKNSNQTAYLAESISCMKVTQSFAREVENEGIFRRLSSSYKKSWMKAVKISFLVSFVVDNIHSIVAAALYVVGLLVIGPASVSLGTLAAMSGYVSRFWQPIINLASLYNNFVNGVAYLERIFETMDEPIKVRDLPDAVELPEIKGNLKFDNVTFSYEADKVILKNVDFDVKAGQSIALVGPTGAGKTTVVNLISRFYDLDSGKILIDGNDISKVTLNSLRRQMGIMLQDSFIFSGTIADNIRYGKLDANDEEIVAACKTVCAHEFIMEMEDGYETELNENGSQLSQGQKQLIAFARTLISDPKILILDEATSSIDVKTERLLQKGLNELLKGRTSFIIAHRLSTIKNCDKIMFINNQGITESGTHEELLEKKGDYYHLYNAQG
ncbi:MAG: ABC transporter ATP-binding protein [Clostridiales bacterium]|nr:ABC transporter ATP-binding protein [Clostridiales bacterium]